MHATGSGSSALESDTSNSIGIRQNDPSIAVFPFAFDKTKDCLPELGGGIGCRHVEGDQVERCHDVVLRSRNSNRSISRSAWAT